MADGSFPTLISKNDDANSPSNPIYTSDVNPPETITKVHAYSTANVAGNGAINNHDYTVVGTTFRLKKVIVASTGKVKFEIKVGPVGTLVTKGVSFTNPNKNYEEVIFDPPVDVANGGIVRVVRQQNQTGNNDVYSTIMGEDIA